MCSCALPTSVSDWYIGISKQIKGKPVSAAKVEVTAESIPPEIPITNPLVLDSLM